MAPTIRASIPLVDKWPKGRVAAWDRRLRARAATVVVTVKDVTADEAQLRQAATAVPRPRALRS